MRKIGILFLLTVFAFSGCSAKGAGNDQSQTVKQTTKTTNKMGTIHLTKAEFLQKVANYEANPQEWKYLGDKPCLIDFYADWCGPCKAVAPILEELAKEYEGKIYIYKIDTDAEQELAGAFGIRSIPSLLFVPMEGKPQMSMGAMPKNQLVEAISEILKVKK
ncbi:MAG: thioredoxin [Bacteroidales bacterium]|nr:thioredoxin [Bacteroidales bacterium]